MNRLATFFLLAIALVVGCNKEKALPQVEVGDFKAAPAYKSKLVEKLPITAPSGWTTKVLGENQPEMMFGPTLDRFLTNINLQEENFSGTLDEYEDGRIEAMKENVIEFKFLSRKEFATPGGAKGIKIAIEGKAFGHSLRRTYYAFDAGGGRKLFYTCTVQSSHGDELDPTFDEIIGTYNP